MAVTGDVVLVGLRDYQDAKGDVILKYSADEARQLKQQGELPDSGTCFTSVSIVPRVFSVVVGGSVCSIGM